ncbi:hypothetical protein L596_004015 [Steinernema carpocapsae]|uniref:Uncharacterized protein n=1 Tax=Steinernema carpocapsae TaxID=34508 RepID=A0A4U8UVZ7_STECR|nr:hypothetical protein L596_004015 [Steinernema carpocapsae]
MGSTAEDEGVGQFADLRSRFSIVWIIKAGPESSGLDQKSEISLTRSFTRGFAEFSLLYNSSPSVDGFPTSNTGIKHGLRAI